MKIFGRAELIIRKCFVEQDCEYKKSWGTQRFYTLPFRRTGLFVQQHLVEQNCLYNNVCCSCQRILLLSPEMLYENDSYNKIVYT